MSPAPQVIVSHSRSQNHPMAGIAYNFILIRIAQTKAKHEGKPRVADDSVIVASPAVSDHNSEVVPPNDILDSDAGISVVPR